MGGGSSAPAFNEASSVLLSLTACIASLLALLTRHGHGQSE